MKMNALRSPRKRHRLLMIAIVAVVMAVAILLIAALLLSKSPSPSVVDNPVVEQTKQKEFISQELGVRFDYPAAWGDPMADHLKAYNAQGKAFGTFYRWKFSKAPNIYIFSPPRSGRLLVEESGRPKLYSYSYDFTKQGDKYCVYFTNDPNRAVCPEDRTVQTPLNEGYEYNNVRTLIRRINSTMDTSARMFYGETVFTQNIPDNAPLQSLDMLSVFNENAIYPSVTIEVLGREQDDLSSELEELRNVAKTVQKL